MYSHLVDYIVVDNKHVNTVGKNASIVLTGKMSIPRSKVAEVYEDSGYEVKSSINTDVDYLICADISSTSSKMKKAKSLGIEILSEEEAKSKFNVNY